MSIDMLDENLSLVLAHSDKVQPAIVCSCFWREVERRARRANIHCSPKDVAAGDIFSIDADLPIAGRIIERQLAKKGEIRCEFFLRRSFLFLVRFCGGKIVSKQAAARSFQKAISPRINACHTDIKRLAFSGVKRLKNFINRSAETKAARQIIGRAERQNRERNPTIHYFPRSFVHSAISSGCNYEIYRLFERLSPAALFQGLIECLMPTPGQAGHQSFPAMFTVPGFRVMNQQHSHDLPVTSSPPNRPKPFRHAFSL